jgi:hypothetical protein
MRLAFASESTTPQGFLNRIGRHMQLWNDYEGKTIADTYSLGQLLRPEGRSALFALSQGADSPAVIRITESINDEGLILANWKRVSEVHQQNLVEIKRFGETNFEGTPLTYAVMEPADANLADLLKERPLTLAEATQVATSLVAAVAALHERGLIHGEIDAAHVVAVGETVKLRTDCVRPCVIHPDDAIDCRKLIQRDVHDLATLVLRTLTLETSLKPGLKLPTPFEKIIVNGISGAWGLPEISAALTPPAPARPASETTPEAVAAATARVHQPKPPAPAASTEPVSTTTAADPLHFQRRIQNSTVRVHPHMKLWVILGAVAVVILAVLIHGISGSGPRNTTQAAENTPAKALPTRQVAAPAAPTRASIRTPNPLPAATQSSAGAPTHLQPGWYVVAYTFNRISDAAHRAAAIAERNPGLQPQVISPNGRSPYLVALGGPMTRPDAESTQRRAKQSGLPRDTFVRNYKGY